METVRESILAELSDILAKLDDNSHVGPAIYDTAQALRYLPLRSDRNRVYEWLKEQQQLDGGWGNPDHPLYRDVPTMAAILALHTRSDTGDHFAIENGVKFLHHQHELWSGALPGDIPVGIELIIPRLLDDAKKAGLVLPITQYEALYHFRGKRLAAIRSRPCERGSPQTHSWEAWGQTATPQLIDGSGGIGHSPAATAAWLKLAKQSPIDTTQIRNAESYLDNAAAGTGTCIAGVLPGFWPMPVFEASWILHTLVLGNLHRHVYFKEYIERIVGYLQAAMTKNGVGFSRFFMPDGDDTSMVMTVLSMIGKPLPYDPLSLFIHGNEFVTFYGEAQPAISTTIHALHAYRLRGEDTRAIELHLNKFRDLDGVWERDKWHASWLYTTCQMVAALGHGREDWCDEQALAGLLKRQHVSGGWGAGKSSTFEETSYAVIAMDILAGQYPQRAVSDAISKAVNWMLNVFKPYTYPTHRLWVDKELYCPTRIARTYELVGLWIGLNWVKRKSGDMLNSRCS